MNNTERLYLVKTASRELLGQLALMGGGGAALGGGLGALTGLFTDDGVLRGAGKGALALGYRCRCRSSCRWFIG